MSVNTKINGQLVKSAGLYSVTAPIGMADIYSTEEKEVGLWKNNKPLYQKTIVIGNGDVNVNTDSGNGTYRAVVDSGISNIDEGFAVVDKSFMILSSDSSPRYFTWVDYQGKGSSQFVVYTNASRTNVTVVLTIQYTKTTDTPWSGKFVPQGYGYVSSGDIYSFEERQVGVWTDGKPLYQKTVDCGTLPNATSKTVAHGISNIDTIVNTYGHAKATANQTPIPFVNNVTVGSQVALFADATNITLRTSDDKTLYTSAYVTILYTKTTDVAGSGEYVPSGDKAVHYSTEEEVVGTWIDGSTLYRKTINFGTLPANTSKSVAHNISNIGYITDIKTTAMREASGSLTYNVIPIPNSHYQTISNQQEMSVNDTSIIIRNGNSNANQYTVCYVTLEYTKTS